jgi:hypothetical protein
VYNDAADTATTPMGTPVSGNVLATANIPAGTTAQVTGFSVAGTTQVYPPGSNVTLNDPVTGAPIGTLVLQSSGAYTFDPVPGYVGPTPAVNVYSRNSNGVTDVSSLTIDVLPGERAATICQAALLGHACAALGRLRHALCRLRHPHGALSRDLDGTVSDWTAARQSCKSMRTKSCGRLLLCSCAADRVAGQRHDHGRHACHRQRA